MEKKSLTPLKILFALIFICGFFSAALFSEQDRTQVLKKTHVKKINISGNTAIEKSEMEKFISPYQDREISFEELQKLRHDLTTLYISKGYINSGVIIPDQKLEEGVVNLQVIEGRLTGVEVTDNKYFRPSYISRRIFRAAGPPLNLNRIQLVLLKLQQNKAINRINAKLSPGIKPGEGILNVKLTENNPISMGLRFSNDRPPSVGEKRAELSLEHINLTGHGDALYTKFGLTEGMDDYDISYHYPINSRDTTLKLQYRKSDSTVIEGLFQPLNIDSSSETIGIGFQHPLKWEPNQEFNLSLIGEHRNNKTYLLGLPFSFSLGAEDGKTRVSVIRFSQDWMKRNALQVCAAKSTFNFGITAYGATSNVYDVDSQFFSWQGQYQLVRRLGERGTQMIFKTNAQITKDQLLPLEKFSVGGANTVRGYRENLFVRDNGVISSLEFRIPLKKCAHCSMHWAPFIDYGKAWDTRSEGPGSILSAGLGLRWVIGKFGSYIFKNPKYLNIYYGYDLKNIPSTGSELQDRGIHIDFSTVLF